MTLARGVNIYGPFDAGFRDGQMCSQSDGLDDCVGGTDLGVCERHMEYVCETQGAMTINRDMLMDSCGGHANYHLHLDPACEYNSEGARYS